MVKRYGAAAVSVAAVAGALVIADLDHAPIAAPLLLFSVVAVARFWGAGPALLAAAAASANYWHFLPPSGLSIEQRDDWIALVTFLVTAVVAGELASRAERRTAEAQAGRQEIERLYQELQVAFERASEAEAARRNEQLKSALLDALTHNLRTPLTAIKASVTALISAHAWGPSSSLRPDGQRELLEIIDEESDRLNRFIEGLSTPERHEPAAPPHLRAVSFDEIVRAGLTRAETVVRNHTVRVHLPGGLPRLSVDAASIAEVVYILVDNASKYAPAGSAITIAAAATNDRLARLTVADQGPGIPPELRERVFERFFRVPEREPADPRRGGVGLGLSIARRLVEAQGGGIWIEESRHGGATVAMTLPVAVMSAEDARAPALSGANT
jgi:two-component system sensor histidine kinase KdpD